MAIKEKGMIRTFKGTGDYELEAKTGESLLIKGIYVSNPANDFGVLYIDKTTVGYFRTGGNRGNHLFYPLVDEQRDRNLLGYLYAKGIFTGYPVGEGQTFIVKNVGDSGTICTVIYDKYDAGDIRPDQMNGSNSAEYLFINYGRPSSAPSQAGDVLIDKTLNPAEFPAFPFGVDVPAKTEIELIGICGSDIGRTSNSGADKNETRFLKFIRERVVLFDDNKDGLILNGTAPSIDGVNIGIGQSIIGYYSDTDQRGIYLFDEPLVFDSGEELNVYINVENVSGSMNLTDEDLELAFITKVKRVG